ncbi:peptide MFS transporter [Asticcacaulis solisilvae]|uniref:peptide MFS transporter n=1 Tax=Asticcacaulis solisilvae TaxID=1217274 RepID=UPI003FD772C7
MLNLIFIAGIVITVLTGIPVALQMRNHPRGLVVCFFMEMWERFSFYGMRGLLIYYLTKQFLFTDAQASAQYASYMTLIYLIPLVGGLVADRWLGTRRAAIFGGILLVVGHFGMAFEGKPAQQVLTYQGHTYEFVRKGMEEPKLDVGGGLYSYHAGADKSLTIDNLPASAPLPRTLPDGSYKLDRKVVTNWAESAFFLSVALIIMGVGFLKPNVSTIVGQLYRDRDPRRDSGFQLYYFGINLGSFWAAIVCGYLGETVGWWAGFGAAGIGMLLGLAGFLLGKSWLMGKGEAPDIEGLKARVGNVVSKEWLIYLLTFAGVAVIYFLVQKNAIVFYVLLASSLGMLGYIVWHMFTKFTRVESFRTALALILSVASIVFFTLEELAGSALSLFADRNVDLDIISAPVRFDLLGQHVLLASREQLAAMGGQVGHGLWIDMSFTAAQTQSINTGWILIFAPIFAALFAFLGRRGADPDPVKKFAFGIVATGLGFLVLVWAAPLHNAAFQLPLVFLVLNYMLTTIGEMTVSPVGLSQQTKLSPAMTVSTMMALWFVGTAWAQYFGGLITEKMSSLTIGGHVVDAAEALRSSLSVFNAIGLVVIGFGAGLFVLSFFVKGWAGGVNDTAPENTGAGQNV